MADKKHKKRVELRKNRFKRPREQNWGRVFEEQGEDVFAGEERVRAKGDISRKRTIIADTAAEAMPTVDQSACLPGRVLRVMGLLCDVETDDGRLVRCAVRRLLKTLATDERNIVTTGDRVWIHLAKSGEGVIERVESRHGLLIRSSKGREHVLVANVDQVVIVMALAEPDLKPHLIDRYLVSAEQGGLRPIVCLNKADLVDSALVQPLIGYYRQLGIVTLPTSAATGLGLDRLKRLLRGRESVFTGQSGVGKSSLLNAVQPGLGLAVRSVSDTTQ